MANFQQDRHAAALYIAGFLPELVILANTAGHDVLGYLLELAKAEAEQLCLSSQTLKTANL